jgi:peptide subunit release factor RF-3
MKNNELTRRRTFGIISHPDAGKTTLTEKLLLFRRCDSYCRCGEEQQDHEDRHLRFHGN